MMGELTKRLERLSRLSPEMLTWRLDGFRNRQHKVNVIPQLREALATGYGWATLSGPPGTGKTYLLAAMTNEARLQHRRAVYTTVADLLDDLRQSFAPTATEPFSALFDDVLNAKVLCLDEIEKFSPTLWAEEKFFQLLEHRYRNWRESLTILATNMPIGLDKPIITRTEHRGYLESRIMDGRFWQLDQFWAVTDARPALKV